MRAKIFAAVFVLVAALVVPGMTAPASALTLPSGFRLVSYSAGSDTFRLINFDFTDDGGLLSIGKAGEVNFTPPGGAPYKVTRLPNIRADGDNGLSGLSLGDDYSVSGRVLLLYPQLDGDGTGRAHAVLSEWQASPPQRPQSFTLNRVIIDGSRTSPTWTQNSLSHTTGTVLQASDGSIYVGNGDDSSFSFVDTNALRALNINDPHGKIFRILPDGRGHPDNPFYDPAAPSSWRSRIFAYGFRNPYRFTIDPRSGALYVGDVGWGSYEEIDLVQPGKSYGWPCYEGSGRTRGYAELPQCQNLYAQPSQPTPPLWSYSHSGEGASVIGGVFYRGATYPSAYRGAFFFGDYTRRQLWTMQTDSAGRLVRAPEAAGFGLGVGGPVAFRAGPNGDIAYADLTSSMVRRLVYSPGNRAPTAVISSTVDAATRTVSFSSAESFDLDGDVLRFSWNFGDGRTSTAANPVHTYASGGTFTVQLTVTDSVGASDTVTATVVPDNYSPILELDAPAKLYRVGEAVHIAATASDAEDGDLSTQVTWQLSLLHCPFAGSCHIHPESTSTGAVFEAQFTDHGADTTMVITASVTDAAGATSRARYEARPDLHTLAVNAPVPVLINGAEQVSVQAVTGSTNSVEAPATRSYWQFVSWSDGGARTHQLTMPAADLTLIATYRTAIDIRYLQLGGLASLLGSPTSREYDVRGGRARDFQRGRMYWSSSTGAKYVYSGIFKKYVATGAHATWGFPTTDEFSIAGGRASYFQKARIYWTRDTGAHEVHGGILSKYLALGGPASFGFPTTDETGASDGIGRYNHFTGPRTIVWTSATGAYSLRGGFRSLWFRLGGGNSRLRYPTSDERSTTFGQIQFFQHGRMEWYRATNTFKVIYS
jgi:glucose/arabinose dehydrogenase/PKD repeat protein